MKIPSVEQESVDSSSMLLENKVNNKLVYSKAKRSIDVIGAILGLLILLPIFLVIGILIKIEDPKGPVFFKQVRVGKDGSEFNMYKFRSMVTDAEEKLAELLTLNQVSGAMFKMKNDPRVTKIGRFIRKTSIDELPQLWNVLKGEMSLVGPRPPLLREVNEYTNYQMQRLLVTPGCTGIWQASARSSVGFEEMVEMDLYYIRNRSLFLDFKIILKTVTVFLGSKNAF
ncbi:exopolysaccharide biosynthesis polyprenyl glycosylphosphotransferase [Bacillus aryabhattai]|uniref:Exopolysaccharide biosynthesis polyprenyl glycosylphosphotransferase n=1 Tax=Priestia aryabhattai TaxID=412384 RepID=A0A7W3NAE1_PRIAR|nr:exopolysaccharide biosynthesis polyprenyl glycosylphosphotransferase [Priestia aryabhattai]